MQKGFDTLSGRGSSSLFARGNRRHAPAKRGWCMLRSKEPQPAGCFDGGLAASSTMCLPPVQRRSSPETCSKSLHPALIPILTHIQVTTGVTGPDEARSSLTQDDLHTDFDHVFCPLQAPKDKKCFHSFFLFSF